MIQLAQKPILSHLLQILEYLENAVVFKML